MDWNNENIDMDKILLDYDRKSREICYDLTYKTEELEKSYIKIGDLKKDNFLLQTNIELLNNTNADLEAKLKNISKRLANAMARGKVVADGSAKYDLLSVENKTLKEKLYKLQKEKDELDQINARNEGKYKCTLLHNEDLLKDRNCLREHVELLTKAVSIKNKENADLQLVKENIAILDSKIKESSFYIVEINILKELNAKQVEQIAYYRAYADQLKDLVTDLKRSMITNNCPGEFEKVMKHHYEHCIEEIESLKSNLTIKLQNERKANELLIKMDSLTRNKYKIAKNETEKMNNNYKSVQIDLEEMTVKYKTTMKQLDDVNNKYNIVKSGPEKVQNKMFVENETQAEITKP